VAYDSQRLESQRAFAEIVPKLNNVVYRLKAISLDRVNAELGQAIPASGTYADAPSILVERGLLGPVGHHLSFTVVRMADVDRANLGALVFCASIAGGLDTDDRGHVAAAYLIMDNRLQETVWSSTEEFEVGSADEEHALQALATGLAQNLASAVHRFAEILRTRVQHAD